MRLKTLTYGQLVGTPNEWRVTLPLGEINLIVGKNASGKTKSLNVIFVLATLLTGKRKITNIFDGDFTATFQTEGDHNLTYKLKFQKGKVLLEEFYLDGVRKLERNAAGEGKIWLEKDKIYSEFHASEGDLAALLRRDILQSPYLTPLHDWAKSVTLYRFGSQMGKDYFTGAQKKETIARFEDMIVTRESQDALAHIFDSGLRESKRGGREFKRIVIEDMKIIGYDLTDVKVAEIESMVQKDLPLYGVSVQEKRLPKAYTDQIDMSQGMYRALAIIVRMNYSTMNISIPNCVLIDDIGEGLDYERSTALIELLLKKAKAYRFHLVMTSNDRFVMNKIPLAYWAVLNLEGHHCTVYNAENSKEAFESFKFTGLNNFDFLTTEFYRDGRLPE